MRSLNPDQRRSLAGIRKLLGAKDLETVRQGVELAANLGDPDILAIVGSAEELSMRVKQRWRLVVRAMLLGASADGATLTELDLSRRESLRDAEVVRLFPRLRRLSLRDCVQMRGIEALASLRDLRELDLSGCKHVRSLDPLRGLEHLESLDLGWCDGLTDIEALRSLRALRRLVVGAPRELAIDRDLAGVTGLVDLTVQSGRLDSLGSLGRMQALERLSLSGLAFADLAPLALLGGLHTLELRSIKPLATLDSLAVLPRLKRVHIGYCQALVDVGALAHCRHLEYVGIDWCEGVTDLRVLLELPLLRGVFVTGSADDALRRPGVVHTSGDGSILSALRSLGHVRILNRKLGP